MVVKRRLCNLPAWSAPAEAPAVCPLCGRALVPGASVDEHHLVPRSEGGTVKERVHRICHRKIHATFGEKERARHFHTWQALREHPLIAGSIAWVANKPPQFFRRHATSGRRRA